MTTRSGGGAVGVLAAAAALLLAGCTGGAGTAGAPVGPTPGAAAVPSGGDPSTAPSTGPTAGPAVSSSPEPEPLATVAPRTRRTLPPAGTPTRVVVGASARASVVGSRRVTVTAQGPGEVGGPGVAVTLAVTNPSGRRLDLGAVAVTAEAGGQAAESSTASPARPLGGTLAPGATVRAVYVFVLPPGVRGPLSLEVSLSPDLPVAAFRLP